jgi:hypothetical protein
MKSEFIPAIIRRVLCTCVLGVVISMVAGCGAEEYKADTKGSEESQQKAASGTFYQPPAAARPTGGSPR